MIAATGSRMWRTPGVLDYLAGPESFRSLTRSRHRPFASTDGSRTENINKIGVRLWTDSSLVKTPVERRDSLWICRRITSVPVGEITLELGWMPTRGKGQLRCSGC